MATLDSAARTLRRGLATVMADRHLRRARRVAPRVARWSLLAAVITFIVSTSQLPIGEVASWIAGAAAFSAAVAILVWAAARSVIWWRLGRARWGIFAPAARRARMTGIYGNSVSRTNENGIALVRVVRVYQVARRGSKCIVEHPWGARQDAWFWYVRPRHGQVLLVRSGVNYGPHTHRHGVMYVGTEKLGDGILYRIPSAAWRIGRKAA